MDERSTTPSDVREALSDALIGVTSCANQIVGDVSLSAGPQPMTTAHVWVDGQNWSTGFSSIMQAISTATDHTSALARVLRRQEDHGPSLAALCRAFAEVAGRAWWLLESKDAAQLEHRAAAMRLDEVRGTGETGVAVRVRDGKYETVSHAEALLDAERALSRASVAGRREKTPNYTALACNVMSAADITNPDGKYSHLSAIAHGAGFSVGGLGARAPHAAEGFTHFTISLPIANAKQYLRITSRVLNIVLEKFIALACNESERERWRHAHVRAHNRIVYIFEELARR